MNQSAQHIALMESLGWTRLNALNQYDILGARPGRPNDLERTPHLTLDMMASAEATLDPIQLGIYLSRLADLFPYRGGNSWQHGFAAAIRATKEQRLEAYLRTKGLYV